MGDTTFFTTGQLRSRGMSVDGVRAAIGCGSLERVIRGWYCTPSTDRGAVRAMRLGGRLGCVSSLHLQGAWQPPEPGLHVLFPSHASGRRLATRTEPAGTVHHWYPKLANSGSAFAVAPLELGVEHLLACQPADFTVAVLDSLLHRRLISANRLTGIIAATAPGRARPLEADIDGHSESGIESVFRYRLRRDGVHVRIQVVVRDRYRVDVLSGDWFVIEVDGRATHATIEGFTRDRERTATIMRDGRLVLQFAYATVMYRWDFVLAVILDVTRQHAPAA